MDRRAEAGRVLNRGLALQGRGEWDEALASYREAAKIDPRYFGPPMNAGLIHKWRGEWRRAAAELRRAFSLVGDHADRSSIAWNLGIASTAIADWDQAFEAWRAVGIPVERAADGSPHLPIGRTPIRLGPKEGRGEIVWADRFDPARARIESVPTPESGHRYGDVVLHDGEPLGKYDKTDLSIFAALARLEKSKHATWIVAIEVESADDLIEGFVEAARREGLLADVCVEDFSESLELLAPPKDDPVQKRFRAAGPVEAASGTKRRIAIAARRADQVKKLLDAWRAGGSSRSHGKPVRRG